MALHAIAAGPFAVRQVMGAEQPIEEREVDREVHIHGLVLEAMMPVVEARADQDLLEEAEAGADIGVNERRIDVDQQRIGLDR